MQKLIPTVVVGAVGVIALAIMLPGLVETNEAGTLQVVQAAVSGDMSCRNQPGMYWQGWGSVFDYSEAETFYFSADEDHDGKSDNPLTTGFNDSTKGTVTGSLRVMLPTDCEQLIHIHRKFHGMPGVMTKLVLPAVRNALYYTGPHMSAAESLAERRTEFAILAEDQLQNGVILTDKAETETVDPITGEKKKVLVVTKKVCDSESHKCVDGFVRDPAAFHEFGIKVTNFVIDSIDYPPTVLAQIETQRQAQMNILTQQAQAREAEARALKADAEARAQIAETRAKEEVAKTQTTVRAEAKKAEAVLKAQEKKEVAALDVESATLEKKAKVLRAEGDAEAAAKLIQADGALKMKLDTMRDINKIWADAAAKQRPTPDIQFGGGAGSNSNPFMDYMNMMNVHTARQLQVDTSIKK